VLFRSVFVGGWTLEAAESVCGAENLHVMNLLTQLVDKSLVTVSESEGTETRYRLLETLRQYALEKLRAAGEEEMLRQKHRDWFLRLAEEAEPHLRGAEQGAWLNRLEAEYANLLAALDWMAARAQDTPLALRLAGALWNYWNIRGYWSEGRERLNRVLASPGASAHAPARAKALIGAGFLALLQADYAAAQELLNESRAIAQQATDSTLAAYALYGLGSIAQRRGDDTQATALFNNALERFRAVGDQWGIASALLNLGSVKFYQDDYVEAHSFFNASLAAFRQLGDKRSIAKVLSNLGLIEYHRQNYSDARALYEASLAVRRELRDKFGVAHQLDNLGYIALRQQNYEQARDLFVESLTLYRAMKSKRHIADVLYGIAGAIAAQGKPECAAQLIGAAEALLEAMGAQVETSNRAEYDRSVAMARARMDNAAFETARIAGRALTMEQAIALAMGDEDSDEPI
jgi:tetratricopeptide (TPR) repeat protein